MKYDFDQIIDRRGTSCLKYDFAVERGKREDVLPLWVADMDFRVAEPILKRLHACVDHGIFGYSEAKDDYFQAVAGWYREHFDWEVKRNWLVKTPGVVFAIAAAVRAFTEKGDGVLLQQPVYYPFSEVIRDNGRELVNSPVGRVWTEEELRRIGDICVKHGVIVVSDEIHSDFVWKGHKHTIFASLSEEYADISVTCTAPSKTFNLAGLQTSNIFIPNRELRHRFRKAVDQAGYSQLNTMGLVACRAAYEEGGEWLEQLKGYLQENLAFARDYIANNLPGIHLIEPEGTYLIWLDFRELGLTEAEREDLIVNKAKLWLDSGAIFGEDGEGFERINIACPRATLQEAFDRLAEALK